MPNIIELTQWENGVYQLETNDPVMGGAEGIDNLQAKQLANRTQYLKAQQEAHAAAADPHPQYMTTAESEAAIAAAVALLVNSSPAALDTLAELATALGNDPNFAATLTNALAAKATWASVDSVLTAAGIVIDHNNAAQLLAALRSAGVFQTAAQFDVTTKAATMEAVQRALGSLSGFTTINADTLLTAAHAGRGIAFTAAAIATLPLANTVSSGTMLWLTSLSGATSVARQGADTIAASSGSSALTSFSLLDGEDLLLESNGNNQWIAVGGSARLNYAGGFGSSLAANGYQKLPSGLIVQWGGTGNISAGGTAVVTYPIAFPIGMQGASVSPSYSTVGAAAAYMSHVNTSSTQLTINNTGAITCAARYIAVGF